MKTVAAGKWLDDRNGFKHRKPQSQHDSLSFEGEGSKGTLGTVTTEEMSGTSLSGSGWSMDSMSPCDGFGAMNDSFLVDEGCWWNETDDVADNSLFNEMNPHMDDSCAVLVGEDKEQDLLAFPPSRRSKSPSRQHISDSSKRRAARNVQESASVGSSDSKSRSSNEPRRRTHKSKSSHRESNSSPRRSRGDGTSRKNTRHRSSSCHATDRGDKRSARLSGEHQSRKESIDLFLGLSKNTELLNPVGKETSSDLSRPSVRPASPRKTRSCPDSPKRCEKKDYSSSRRSDRKDGSRSSEHQSSPHRTSSSRQELKQEGEADDPPERPRRTKRHVSRRQSMTNAPASNVSEPQLRVRRSRRASLY